MEGSYLVQHGSAATVDRPRLFAHPFLQPQTGVAPAVGVGVLEPVEPLLDLEPVLVVSGRTGLGLCPGRRCRLVRCCRVCGGLLETAGSVIAGYTVEAVAHGEG